MTSGTRGRYVKDDAKQERTSCALNQKNQKTKEFVLENLLTLNQIKTRVNNLAKLINVPKDSLPTYGYSRDFAYPHIEVDQIQYHYVIVERGQEIERKSTNDLNKLLYWIFDSITFELACGFELNNRVEKQDCRRIIFAKQEGLLKTLNSEWSEIKNKEHEEILKKNPFDDLASLRATYYGELRKKGLSEIESDKLAYEKYPE